jgi:myo-inositol-1(or 4)-monophosphatase
VVATGFPFRRKDRIPRYVAMFGRCLDRFEDLRRPGAAALDLAWLAAGRLDGYYERGLNPWDWAAGRLLVEEAGGAVTELEGEPAGLVAASPPLLDGLLELVG